MHAFVLAVGRPGALSAAATRSAGTSRPCTRRPPSVGWRAAPARSLLGRWGGAPLGVPPPTRQPPHTSPAPAGATPWTATASPVTEEVDRDEYDTDDDDAEEAEPYVVPVEFVRAVQALLPAGRYAAGGLAVGLPNPVIRLRGMDHILPWPCPPASAAAAMAVAARAPFGRGTETVLDPAVRSSWRVGPADLSFGNTVTWEAALAGVVAEARQGLGVAGPIRAELHNLLLYGTGDHFAAHRDTEKVEGQFGTLVLTLPAVHEGGSLVVHHDGQSMAFPPKDVGGDATLAHATWAAYYGDCKHEVQPVTSGHRVALVYNLVREEADAEDQEGGEVGRASWVAPDQAPAIAALSALATRWSSLRAAAVAAGSVDPPCSLQSKWHWRDSCPDDDWNNRYDDGGMPRCMWEEDVELSGRAVVPDKLVRFLDHQYSVDGLGWGSFKGRDAALVDALLRARVLAAGGGGGGGASSSAQEDAAGASAAAPATAPAFTLHAVPVRVERLDLDPEHDTESYIDLHFAADWLPAPGQAAAARPADRHFGWDHVAHDDEERLLEDRAADGRDFEPHGNEGARLTRWYQTVALVIQPAPTAAA